MRVLLIALLLMSSSATVNASEGVILLHGLCRSSKSMEPLAAVLSDEGYVVVNCDYPSRSKTVEGLAEETIPKALEDSTLKNCERIHFVAHSMGGMLVRVYFRSHSDRRLGRVVMLGPPNKGSEVVDKVGSWWVFKQINGIAGCELGTLPGSLQTRLGPVNFDLGVIAGDRTINWINSFCMINGPDDGKVSVENTKVDGMEDHVVVHAMHPTIMNNRSARAHILSFLKSGSFVHQ